MFTEKQRAVLRSKVGRHIVVAERQERVLWDKLQLLQNQVRTQVAKFEKTRDGCHLPVLTPLPTAKDIKENAKRRKAYATVHRVSERWTSVLFALRSARSKMTKHPAGTLRSGTSLSYVSVHAAVANYEKLRNKEKKS